MLVRNPRTLDKRIPNAQNLLRLPEEGSGRGKLLFIFLEFKVFWDALRGPRVEIIMSDHGKFGNSKNIETRMLVSNGR